MYYDIIKSAINRIAQLIDSMVCSLKGSDYMANKPERKIPAKEKLQSPNKRPRRVYLKSSETSVVNKTFEVLKLDQFTQNEIDLLNTLRNDSNITLNDFFVKIIKRYLEDIKTDEYSMTVSDEDFERLVEESRKIDEDDANFIRSRMKFHGMI